MRALALDPPWLIRLMVLRRPNAPWLSHPLSSPACTTIFLDAHHHRGHDLASSVSTYRTVNAFLLAHLLPESIEAVQGGRGLGSYRPTSSPTGLLRQYPVLANHANLLGTNDYVAEFQQALHDLVRTITRRTR